jgi:hypothetical protein
MKKDNIVYLLCTVILLLGAYLLTVNLFWCAIFSTKAATSLEALQCFTLNKFALQMHLGILLIIGDMIFLYRYEKKIKKEPV